MASKGFIQISFVRIIKNLRSLNETNKNSIYLKSAEKKSWVYPVLFALFPIVFLYSNNIHELYPLM